MQQQTTYLNFALAFMLMLEFISWTWLSSEIGGVTPPVTIKTKQTAF